MDYKPDVLCTPVVLLQIFFPFHKCFPIPKGIFPFCLSVTLSPILELFSHLGGKIGFQK